MHRTEGGKKLNGGVMEGMSAVVGHIFPRLIYPLLLGLHTLESPGPGN